MFDERDFDSDDPVVRFNAHQLAKGRAGLDTDAWDNRDKTAELEREPADDDV